MAGIYTDAQKSLAKTLLIATGSTDQTLELLRTIWGKEADDSDDFTAPSTLPSPRSLGYWKADSKIPVDEQLAAEWSQQARLAALSTASRLAEKMASAVELSLDRYRGTEVDGVQVEKPSGTALDVLNITKSFGILNDKQNGRYGNAPGVVAPGGVQINGGNVQIVAWAPKEIAPPVEATVIDQPGEAA